MTSKELKKLLPKTNLSIVQTPENEDINSMFVEYGEDAIVQLLNERKSFLSTENLKEKVENQKGKGEKQTVQTPLATSQKAPMASQSKLNIATPEYITFISNQLHITILGGINLQQIDRLRLTLKISRSGGGSPLHSIRHTIDLYHTDYLEKFINKASEQLEIGTNIVRTAIAELTEQIENYRLSKIESLKKQKPKRRELSPERTKKAVKYLSSPNLLERTNQDIGKTGMIGEENNRLLMYLVFTSRMREQPLHLSLIHI